MNSLIQLINNLPITKIKGLWFTELDFYLIIFVVLTLGFFLQTRKVKFFLFSLATVVLLTIFSLFNHFKTQQQQQIVIYNANNNSVIDFIDRAKVYSFRNADLKQKDYEFASQNHQWKLNIETVDTININENFEINSLKKQGNLMLFHQTSLFIINKKTDKIWQKKNLSEDKIINIDYLILRENPKVKIENLISQFHFKKIIFDSSNSFWYIKNWKTECTDLGISYHDVKNDFAFILEL